MDNSAAEGKQDKTSAADCVRSARRTVGKVRDTLTIPSSKNAEQSAEMLRDVEVQLGCALALLNAAKTAEDVSLRQEINTLKRETEFLGLFFSEMNEFLGKWLQQVSPYRSGYTKSGKAAPLFLVSKISEKG